MPSWKIGLPKVSLPTLMTLLFKFLLTHLNNFNFFIDPLYVFHWQTSTTSSFSLSNCKFFIEQLQPLQVFHSSTLMYGVGPSILIAMSDTDNSYIVNGNKDLLFSFLYMSTRLMPAGYWLPTCKPRGSRSVYGRCVIYEVIVITYMILHNISYYILQHTLSFSLNNINHFKFFIDPHQPFQVFHWLTRTTSRI